MSDGEDGSMEETPQPTKETSRESALVVNPKTEEGIVSKKAISGVKNTTNPSWVKEKNWIIYGIVLPCSIAVFMSIFLIRFSTVIEPACGFFVNHYAEEYNALFYTFPDIELRNNFMKLLLRGVGIIPCYLPALAKDTDELLRGVGCPPLSSFNAPALHTKVTIIPWYIMSNVTKKYIFNRLLASYYTKNGVHGGMTGKDDISFTTQAITPPLSSIYDMSCPNILKWPRSVLIKRGAINHGKTKRSDSMQYSFFVIQEEDDGTSMQNVRTMESESESKQYGLSEYGEWSINDGPYLIEDDDLIDTVSYSLKNVYPYIPILVIPLKFLFARSGPIPKKLSPKFLNFQSLHEEMPMLVEVEEITCTRMGGGDLTEVVHVRFTEYVKKILDYLECLLNGNVDYYEQQTSEQFKQKLSEDWVYQKMGRSRKCAPSQYLFSTACVFTGGILYRWDVAPSGTPATFTLTGESLFHAALCLTTNYNTHESLFIAKKVN